MAVPQARFVEGNLFRHVAVMSLTGSVGLMAIFIVDLINMVYISWLKDPVLTAATGYAGAVMFFTTAFGIGLSIGVSALVAQAHVCRSLARSAERRCQQLNALEPLAGVGLAYINRLSDLLFVAARIIGRRQGVAEVLWQPAEKPNG